MFEKTEHFLSKPRNISLFGYRQNGAFSQVFVHACLGETKSELALELELVLRGE